MIILAVNYHYVSESRPVRPQAVFPVTPAELEEQIRTITTTFEPVSRAQLVDAVRGDGGLPDQAVLFTFDDGLREQYELALPVFERLACPVVFFVPGRPLGERRALNVHRIHRLRETLADEDLLRLLEPRLEGASHTTVDETAATAMYRYDTPDAARIKYLLNVVLGPERSDAVVGAVFAQAFGDEASFVEWLYMTGEQAADLEARGFLGAHAHSHVPLARLSADEQRRELETNLAVLEAATGRRPPVVSYPYGGVDAVDVGVARVAEEAGLVVGFTMERALNRSLEQPLLLARIDCVDAPGGRSPLFDAADPLGPDAAIAPARARYLDEASAATETNARA